MKYAPTAWKAELASWRTVIQLNLIRSIITILDTLQSENAVEEDDSYSPRPSFSSSVESTPDSLSPTQAHQLLALRLSPLRQVEVDLKRRLGAGSTEVDDTDADEMWATPFSPVIPKRSREFGVRGWKALGFGRPQSPKQNSDPDEATKIIASCQEDMKALWGDPVVRRFLERKGVRVEHKAGL